MLIKPHQGRGAKIELSNILDRALTATKQPGRVFKKNDILIAFSKSNLVRPNLMRAFFDKWKNISIAKRLYFVIGGMGALIIYELIALQFAMHTLTAARAFVGGEGLWSKSQKNAVISLQQYGITKSEADYRSFLQHLKVSEGDHRARIELLKPNPDLSIVRDGFLQGGIQPEDINPMIDLIQRFHKVSYLARALEVWAQADGMIEEFKIAGASYRRAIRAGDQTRASKALAQIRKVNDELTVIENEFSYQLGLASHWLEIVVLTLLSIAVLIVETIGLTLTVLTIRAISKGLSTLNLSAAHIGRGDFSKSLKPLDTSNDEIGLLAKSIQKMGQMLQHSYSDLESRVRLRTIELAQSRDQLDIILKGISDGIIVVDEKGTFVFANRAGARMCGFQSAQELLSTPQEEVVSHFEMTDEYGYPFPIEKLPSRLAFGGSQDNPEVLLRVRQKKTGEVKWSLVSSTPIYDESKKTRLVVTIFKDFTEHKQAEDSVKFLDAANNILSSSLDYEATLQNLADLVVPKLADWCAIHIIEEEGKAPRSIALAHPDPNKIEWAKKLGEKYPPDWNAPNGVAKALRSGRAELISEISDQNLVDSAIDEEHLQLLRGLEMNSVMIIPLVSRGRSFAVITMIRTLTGKKYNSKDLLFAEELARRAAAAIDNALLFKNVQKAVRARDEFLSIASHELKTPLTSLSLQIQMTKQNINVSEGKTPTAEKLTKIFEASDKQVSRLNRLVEDLLDVSRIQSGNLSFEFDRTNLSEIVKEILHRSSEQFIKANCPLEMNIQENVIGYLDSGRIEQVIENLISNVLKYAPGKPVKISLSGSARRAQLTVEDSGPGIQPEMQSKIFERFERANPSRYVTGLGLGLYIVKEIVKAHHGDIILQSTPGIGSKFSIDLPLTMLEQSFTSTSARNETHGTM